MEVETSLAKPARTRVELRDPQKNYNKMSVADLKKLMPDFKWDDYFQQLNLAAPGAINVGQPDFFKAADQVFKNRLARRLEDLSALAPRARRGADAFEGFRRREFRLLSARP